MPSKRPSLLASLPVNFASAGCVFLGGCLSLNQSFQDPGAQAQGMTSTAAVHSGSNNSSPTTTDASLTSQDTPLETQTASSDIVSGSSNPLESSSTDLESSSSSSSSSTSLTTGYTTTGATQAPSCDVPTICYRINDTAQAKQLAEVNFDAIATIFPKDGTPMKIARVEYFTGEIAAVHTLQFRKNNQGIPGDLVYQRTFDTKKAAGWYGVDIDPPIEVNTLEPQWITWVPAIRALPALANAGDKIPVRRKRLPTSSWANLEYAMMMRVYCCPL